MAKKKVATKAVVVSDGIKVGDKEFGLDELRVEARANYKRMQYSWFDFARVAYAIHEEKAFLQYGYDSFREFCINEYKELDYVIVLKFVHVYREFGKNIEERLKKKPDIVLPNYNSFYYLVGAKKKLAPEELTKLKKDLLEQKLTYRKLMSEVKDRTEVALKKEKEKIDKFEKEIEAKEDSLYEDIKDKSLPKEVEGLGSAEDFTDEVDESELGKVGMESIETLKSVMTKMLSGKVDESVAEFGNKLEEFQEVIEDFLNGLEKL